MESASTIRSLLREKFLSKSSPICISRIGRSPLLEGGDLHYSLLRSTNMNAWIDQVFNAKSARNMGGIVRRSIKSVHKHASLDDLRKEVKIRGFHMVESGDQYVIL